VVEDLVVVGEVVAGDDVDAGIFLNLPVLETQPLALGEEVFAGQLVAFFRSRSLPMRGKPRIDDCTIVPVV